MLMTYKYRFRLLEQMKDQADYTQRRKEAWEGIERCWEENLRTEWAKRNIEGVRMMVRYAIRHPRLISATLPYACKCLVPGSLIARYDQDQGHQRMKSTLSKIYNQILPARYRDAIWVGRQHLVREREIRKTRMLNQQVATRLVERGEPIRLELGAGTRTMPGWATVDNNGVCDITMTLVDPLPFPNECVEEIYASHVLEHFHHPQLMYVLLECHRVLKPGGAYPRRRT